MRMWGLYPKMLCKKHLIGEHGEMHMFIGTIKKGKNIRGFIEDGLVEVQNIVKRHDLLAEEMVERGYNHNSPLPKGTEKLLWKSGHLDLEANILDLFNRCPECKKRGKEYAEQMYNLTIN